MSRYVITGCSQSGTMYAAELLTGCGLACAHEGVYDWAPGFGLAHQRGAAAYLGDSSYVAAPFVQTIASNGGRIVHLVRPPLDQIRSTLTRGHLDAAEPPPWVRFLDHHIGLLAQPAGPERAAWYWLRWNELVDRQRDAVWRLGDIGAREILDLAELADLDVDPETVDHWLERVPRDVNASDPQIEVTINDLGPLGDEVIAAAKRYGVPLTGELASGGIIDLADAPFVGENGPETPKKPAAKKAPAKKTAKRAAKKPTTKSRGKETSA